MQHESNHWGPKSNHAPVLYLFNAKKTVEKYGRQGLQLGSILFLLEACCGGFISRKLWTVAKYRGDLIARRAPTERWAPRARVAQAAGEFYPRQLWDGTTQQRMRRVLRWRLRY